MRLYHDCQLSTFVSTEVCLCILLFTPCHLRTHWCSSEVTYEQLQDHLIQVTIVCMYDYAEEPQAQPSLLKLSVLKLQDISFNTDSLKRLG